MGNKAGKSKGKGNKGQKAKAPTVKLEQEHGQVIKALAEKYIGHLGENARQCFNETAVPMGLAGKYVGWLLSYKGYEIDQTVYSDAYDFYSYEGISEFKTLDSMFRSGPITCIDIKKPVIEKKGSFLCRDKVRRESMATIAYNIDHGLSSTKAEISIYSDELLNEMQKFCGAFQKEFGGKSCAIIKRY